MCTASHGGHTDKYAGSAEGWVVDTVDCSMAEGWGESAVGGLEQPNDLSVTCSTFPPMVCWSRHCSFTGQAQIQSDMPIQCDSLF